MMQPMRVAADTVNGIAVDFGGTKIAVARLSAGNMVDYQRFATDKHADGDQQIRHVCDAIACLAPRPDETIAVAASGRIDLQGRWYAINQQTLSQINGIPLQHRLTQHYGRSVAVVNDAVAGAAGEASAGAGKDYARFAYVTVSTGVGGTCVIDGVPMVSPNGVAGNVGFMTSRQGNQRCGSGRLGTIESIASGLAIAAAAERAGYPGLTAQEIFEFAKAQAPWAVSLIRMSATVIAELGVNLAVVTGISRLVVGGSVGLADGYCELVAEAVQAEPELFQFDVVPAQLGQASVLIGALALQEN